MTAVTLVDVIKPLRQWRRRRQLRSNDISFSTQEVVGKYSSTTSAIAGDKTVIAPSDKTSSTQALQDDGDEDDDEESYDIILTKILTVVFGAITIGLAFAATKMGTLVSMAFTIFGAVGAPLVGVFTLGMLWTRANEIGTLIGVMAGSTLGIWVAVGATVNTDNLDDSFGLYRLSVMWYGTFTLLTTVIIAIPCCEIVRLILPKETYKEIDPSLLAPFLRKRYTQDDPGESKPIGNHGDESKM